MSHANPLGRLVAIGRRLVLYAAVSAAIMFGFSAIGDSDVGQLGFLLAYGGNGVLLLVVASWITRLRIVAVGATMATYVLVAWPLLTHFYDVHTFVRWQLVKDADRVRVVAQPRAPDNEFRHLDWDGWGFAGMETEVYLVFDPTDSLAPAAAAGKPGTYAGIPCPVPVVRRLERRFYAVQFYTDTDWSHCTY